MNRNQKRRTTLTGTSKSAAATRRSDKLARETVVARFVPEYHNGLCYLVQVRNR